MSGIRAHSLLLPHGLLLPHKPLSDVELKEAAEALGIPHFRGVFMRDALPPNPNPIECGILNHDDYDGSGTHWTCWHKRRGLKVYFDSYGLPPPDEMVDYLRIYPEIRYNTDKLQQRGDVVCGHFCLHVLKLLAEGWSFEDVIFGL